MPESLEDTEEMDCLLWWSGPLMTTAPRDTAGDGRAVEVGGGGGQGSQRV